MDFQEKFFLPFFQITAYTRKICNTPNALHYGSASQTLYPKGLKNDDLKEGKPSFVSSGNVSLEQNSPILFTVRTSDSTQETKMSLYNGIVRLVIETASEEEARLLQKQAQARGITVGWSNWGGKGEVILPLTDEQGISLYNEPLTEDGKRLFWSVSHDEVVAFVAWSKEIGKEVNVRSVWKNRPDIDAVALAAIRGDRLREVRESLRLIAIMVAHNADNQFNSATDAGGAVLYYLRQLNLVKGETITSLVSRLRSENGEQVKELAQARIDAEYLREEIARLQQSRTTLRKQLRKARKVLR